MSAAYVRNGPLTCGSIAVSIIFAKTVLGNYRRREWTGKMAFASEQVCALLQTGVFNSFSSAKSGPVGEPITANNKFKRFVTRGVDCILKRFIFDVYLSASSSCATIISNYFVIYIACISCKKKC
jgi:hypothetical protein